MSDLDPAVEAIVNVLHARDCGGQCEPHTYAATYLPTAEAIFTAAAPIIAAQATKEVRAERDSILRRIDRLESDESWWIGGAWGDYGEAVIPLRALSTLTGPLADVGPKWETDPGFAATYGDLRATVEMQATELADLRASRDGWASRMMEFAEAQQALADLRARIEALRDEWSERTVTVIPSSVAPASIERLTWAAAADALDALIGGA